MVLNCLKYHFSSSCSKLYYVFKEMLNFMFSDNFLCVSMRVCIFLIVLGENRWIPHQIKLVTEVSSLSMC